MKKRRLVTYGGLTTLMLQEWVRLASLEASQVIDGAQVHLTYDVGLDHFNICLKVDSIESVECKVFLSTLHECRLELKAMILKASLLYETKLEAQGR